MVIKFCVSRRWFLLVASLLVVVLFSSLFVGVFVNSSSGVSLENAVHVKSEDELKNAINNAPTGKSTVIALDNDITLTNTTNDHNSNYWPVSIIIPADRDITLTCNKNNGYYKLNGAVNGTILFVAPNGTLRIDGISVIHTSNTGGGGVTVYTFAEFYFYNGIISGNKIYGGHGVSNMGTFVMYGGEISGNTAENGGGVYNSGYATFKMFGGTISGNTATNFGGGVYNSFYSVFTMLGGTISGNTADYGGGLYNTSNGEFTLSGGIISGNTATNAGNDVYPNDSGDDLPIGNGGSSNGNNNGFTDDNDDGTSNGNNGASIDGFSLRDLLITCVITVIVTLCIILFVFIVLSQKNRANREKTKQS